ncbi:MAG: hypothetical protein K8S87_04640, partial [Planctomycetes bacterium]|nr:hypothetical protein [Planctomycetota bacterium]
KIIGLILSIISILACIFFVITIIINSMYYYSNISIPGATWISYYYYYVYNIDHLIILLVLAISIYCVIVLFKNKFSKVHNTPVFAEPVMHDDDNPQEQHTEPQAEDKTI